MTVDVRDGRVRFRQEISEPYASCFMVAYVTETAAAEMHSRFESIRRSAVSALPEEDDFLAEE